MNDDLRVKMRRLCEWVKSPTPEGDEYECRLADEILSILDIMDRHPDYTLAFLPPEVFSNDADEGLGVVPITDDHAAVFRSQPMARFEGSSIGTVADLATDSALAEVKAADPEGTAEERSHVTDEQMRGILEGATEVKVERGPIAGVEITPVKWGPGGVPIPMEVPESELRELERHIASAPTTGTIEETGHSGVISRTAIPSAPPVRESEIFKIDPPIKPRADGSVKFSVTIKTDAPPPKPCPQCGSFECAGPEDSDTCEFEAAAIADEPFTLDPDEEPPY